MDQEIQKLFPSSKSYRRRLNDHCNIIVAALTTMTTVFMAFLGAALCDSCIDAAAVVVMVLVAYIVVTASRLHRGDDQ